MEAWGFTEDKCSRKGASTYKNQVKTEMSTGLDCRGNQGWDNGKAVGRRITSSERVEKASVDNTLEGWPGGKTWG